MFYWPKCLLCQGTKLHFVLLPTTPLAREGVLVNKVGNFTSFYDQKGDLAGFPDISAKTPIQTQGLSAKVSKAPLLDTL